MLITVNILQYYLAKEIKSINKYALQSYANDQKNNVYLNMICLFYNDITGIITQSGLMNMLIASYAKNNNTLAYIN